MITFQNLGKYGRLGNQMFQYATLYSIGKELNYDIGVPYKARSSTDKMDFCLHDGFEITAPDSSNAFSSSIYIEPHYHYDPNIRNIPDGCDLRGYFQSEKYFKKYKHDLLNKEFKFKPEIENKANSFLKGCDSEVISVHIRLGDYLHMQDCHPVCSVEYYRSALELLPKDCSLILFSDDYQKALELFKSFGVNIMMTGGSDKFVDMCLMTKCDYHVIANSSFSWWGSWLSKSKKTIAPNKWYGDSPNAPKNWKDIYCDDWSIV